MQKLGSINEILSVGQSALSASRARLTVAGYNIANAHTPGYHRETVALTPHSVLGGGVSVGNPFAIRNNLLARNLVQTFGRMGYHDGAKDTLVQVQETFNELDGIGLMTSLDSFQASIKELASNPSGSAERQTMLGTAEQLISQFHSLANQLESAILASEEQAEELGEQVSVKAAQVFTLNAEIKSLASTGVNPESMIDERDRIVGEIGEIVDVTVVNQSDGSVDLFIAGGRPLVTDAHTSTLSVQKSAGPPQSISVTITKGDGNEVVAMADIGGRLGGVVDAMNDTLGHSLHVVDEIAFGMANAVNAVHAGGVALDGTAGNSFFEVGAVATGAAGGIRLHADVDGQPNRIAASKTLEDDGVTPVPIADIPGDNRNLYDLIDSLDLPGVVALTGESVHGAYETLMVETARAINTADLGLRTETTTANQLQGLIQSETGVSVDEEMIEMTQANQAFEAAAMVIRQADSMAETLLGLVG
jgi:flagellar hook-associated protein 1